MPRLCRMTVYDLHPAANVRLEAGHLAFAFAHSGEMLVAGKPIASSEGDFVRPGEAVSTTGCAWLFEVSPGNASVRPGLSPVLSRLVTPPDEDLMLRADRVESTDGAQTPAHRHRGPGIRRLLHGLLLADVGGHLDRIGPEQPWFESGTEAVVGKNISGGTNAFVRVMLLPAALAGGQSSFIAMSPKEAAKPRAATIRLLGEHPVSKG
jgi:hypothetical protein